MANEKLLEGVKVVSFKDNGRKKYHVEFPDGKEQVDEYSEKTKELLLRKTRKPKPFGGNEPWIVEVGSEDSKTRFDPAADLVAENAGNPVFLRMDTTDTFQWRVRNLPYKKEVYSVEVDDEKQQIVIRTSNKKYFKRIDVADMARHGLKLDKMCVTWEHKNNTLIVSYPKPDEVMIWDLRIQAMGDANTVTA